MLRTILRKRFLERGERVPKLDSPPVQQRR
jgi:hypothetical protein